MVYLSLKALHVIAVITWVGGMIVVALTLRAMRDENVVGSARSSFVGAIRQWDQRVTSPAMLLVWVLGLTLASQGGWASSPWLALKLVLVVVLSGFHGVLSGRLRRLLQSDPAMPPAALRYAPTGILVCVVGIVFLVIVKPW